MKKKVIFILIALAVVVVASTVYGLSKRSNSQNNNEIITADLVNPRDTEYEENDYLQTKRDVDRKNAAAIVNRKIVEYTSDNNGRLPTAEDVQALVDNYDDRAALRDPKTNLEYVITETEPELGEIGYLGKYKCEPGGNVTGGSTRSYVLLPYQESGIIYCMD